MLNIILGEKDSEKYLDDRNYVDYNDAFLRELIR